jgi:hypothetical protein
MRSYSQIPVMESAGAPVPHRRERWILALAALRTLAGAGPLLAADLRSRHRVPLASFPERFDPAVHRSPSLGARKSLGVISLPRATGGLAPGTGQGQGHRGGATAPSPAAALAAVPPGPPPLPLGPHPE